MYYPGMLQRIVMGSYQDISSMIDLDLQSILPTPHVRSALGRQIQNPQGRCGDEGNHWNMCMGNSPKMALVLNLDRAIEGVFYSWLTGGSK